MIVLGVLFFFNYQSLSDEQDYYYNREYIQEQSSNEDKELQRVLNRIAGTYELVEDMGIYGFKTIYTVSINRDGTGYTKFAADGSVEYFYGAYLSGPNRIVFEGDYGGTPFKVVENTIEDETASRERTEIGTLRYHMRKR